MDSTQRTRPRTGGSPVGLVVFIILTVAFAVLSYVAFAKYQSTAEELGKSKTSLTAADSAKQKALDVNAKFQKTTGVDTPESLQQAVADALAATRAEGYGEGAQETAKDAMEQAVFTIKQLKAAMAALSNSYGLEMAAHKNLAEQKTASDAAYDKALSEKTAEIQTLQKTLADEKARLQARIDKEIADREALRNVFYNEQDAWKASETRYILKIAQFQQRNRELGGEGTIIEKAGGVVTDIDIRNKLATINIGTAAGVKSGMRFVAYSEDAAGNPIRKGVIEVVRPDINVSVGRIVSVESGMAVGKNDYVYNLAGPRKKLFVFAGTPKIYTIEQWTNFIRANGGDVVEDVRKGDQVADYLILGEFDESVDTKARQMIFDARDFTLKIMKEAELKDALGLK